MVKETEYYDLLEISPTATELEIKKAYRKLAIRLHPDKNPDDETAKERFQAVSEAYQVLSDENLRGRYDKFGKESAVPDSGFEDPSEFFSMIFGGEAFADLIGEISLMKDLTRTIEITQKHAEENGEFSDDEDIPPHLRDQQRPSSATGTPPPDAPKPATSTAAGGDAKVPPPAYAEDAGKTATGYPDEKKAAGPSASASGSGTSTPRRGVPTRPMISHISHDDHLAAEAESSSMASKKKKKGGLTEEQLAELKALEEERKKARQERVDLLVRKLVDRLSIWTETDKDKAVTHSFNEKTRLEAENLKMESFGIDILHTIGAVYTSKGQSFIKSQRFFGVPGFISRIKDKGAVVKETWNTISSAIEAQMTIEEMNKLQEAGGDSWTEEKKAEFERRVTGKILAAAWKGSRFEISSVLREVCDKVLNDPTVNLQKRVERAHALVMVGTIFSNAERDPDDEMAEGVFEALVADAAKPRKKEKPKSKKVGGMGGFFSRASPGASGSGQQQKEEETELPASGKPGKGRSMEEERIPWNNEKPAVGSSGAAGGAGQTMGEEKRFGDMKI